MSNINPRETLAMYQSRLRAVGEMVLPEDYIFINSTSQQLQLIQKGELTIVFPISTAANGLGCCDGSFQTPTGLHRISEKIGSGVVLGSVFKGRLTTGELAKIESDDVDTGMDQITSRILWLEGLEVGLNKGEAIDTHARYIYIHGTNEEGRLGQAVSHGCIRMSNDDVITLFERVESGMLVLIA